MILRTNSDAELANLRSRLSELEFEFDELEYFLGNARDHVRENHKAEDVVKSLDHANSELETIRHEIYQIRNG